jgi:hypothetical protein
MSEQVTDKPIESGELTKDQMYDYLKGDETEELDADKDTDKDTDKEIGKEESKKVAKEVVEEDREVEEDEDEEDKEKEDDEDEIKLKDAEEEEEKLEIHTPVSRKKILERYPKLFKDFPWMESAIYRNYQYTEILPTLDDAKEAVENSKTFNEFRADLMEGNIEKTLATIKNANEDSFNKIADSYLQTLGKVDEKAYYHVVGNVIKNAVVGMIRESKRSNNEDLQSAAQILNQFMFGTSEFEPPSNLSKQSNETENEKAKLKAERESFIREKFDSTSSDLDEKVSNTLKSTISEYIDPKGVMTDYVKKNAVREALEDLNNLMGQDKQFTSTKDRLWERVFESNFSKQSVDGVRSAYLSKAKTLLPNVIKKARNEALKGSERKVQNEDKDKRGPITPGRTATSKSRTNAKEIPKGMTTYDFLNQD